ncbi:MAG TPA: ribonuclease P protein component [Tenericutes bacterium]|jgi:ribonuclease P protein component|nr:ribonuclease P protein component [Mycoplasmatota bacterium]
MKKKYRIKDKREFQDIINTGNKIHNEHYVIYNKDNNLPYSRFGIAVSKKIGKAVLRNKTKRQLRAIISQNQKNFINNKDYIIIVKNACRNISFKEKQDSLLNLLTKEKEGTK